MLLRQPSFVTLLATSLAGWAFSIWTADAVHSSTEGSLKVKRDRTEKLPLIPYPASLQRDSDAAAFHLSGALLELGDAVPEEDLSVRQLRELIGSAAAGDCGTCAGRVSMQLEEGQHPEGYRLHVDSSHAKLSASSLAGLFHGVQTIKQLAPRGESTLPAVSIEDEPRFPWRGLHLDVSRHFFDTKEVKRLLDVMADFKLNRFHWHLTDDQGWRLPVPLYPRLTEIGAESVDGARQAYTADEIRDIVNYATQRHIEIIPEVDNPGHSQAALAAYPEFGNMDSAGWVPPDRPMKEWGVSKYTLAPNADSMMFLDAVFSQVSNLFPSSYVHIGGDEADVTEWRTSSLAQGVSRRQGTSDVQAVFNKHMGEVLASKHKRVVGWDEVQHKGGLPSDAVVMAWRSEDEVRHAARRGHEVINANAGSYYLDWRQGELESPRERAYLPLRKTYEADVVPTGLSELEAARVIGAQGQLWTEFMDSPDRVEYMAFPRALALAERTWTPVANGPDYEDFVRRLKPRLHDLDAMKVKYRALG